MSHTPGPWELREGWEEVFGPGIYTPDAHETEPHAAVSQFDPNAEDDARLIAAAPDLLAALDKLCEHPCPDMYDERWDLANAAIAKARGTGVEST